jgi:pyruvate dehydrogenase E2 component (dihydrolipoamide acetyltransferase)
MAVDQLQTAVGVAETAKGSTTIVELSRGERAIVRRVAEARATVPDVEYGAVVDASAWAAPGSSWCTIPTAALVRAAGLALREHPRANAAYRDGHFELYSRVNVGVTIAASDGYLTPTVFDADLKSLAEIEAELASLQARALAGELTPPELAGGTFSVLNLGSSGTARATAVLIPPHASALAAGAVRPAAVVRSGEVVPGHQLELTLACDHRILYGAHATGVLDRLVSLLSEPEGS